MSQHRSFSQGLLPKLVQGFAFGAISALLTALPLNAAQRLYFVYSPISLSLGIDSLATFAEEGVINKDKRLSL
ncbi:MAG TPA: dienelactone hydrolase, partial [Cyanothece sp. UBA12306]|nr:dienelactone hydrolase [Cyanothece sp. UBA12306]